jgi:hypothetical protein
MRGPNPFTSSGAGLADFRGRKAELEICSEMLKGVAAGRPGIMDVSGSPGSGKSALLRRLRDEAEGRGFFSLIVSAGDRESSSSLLSDMNAELLNYADGKAAEGRISQRVASAIRAAAGGGFFLLPFARIAGRHSEGLVLMIDDADSLRDAGSLAALLSGALDEAERDGLKLGLVLSSASAIPGLGERVRNAPLGPFEEHDVREMVEGALKKGPPKMGEECLRSVVEESEGNPRVATTICRVLYDRLPEKEKIMTKRHYITFYPAIMGVLGREFFDPLFRNLPPSEREVLRAFAASEGRPSHISDIARRIGKRHATTLAMRLEARGQLVRVDRGLYKVFTRLYGRYALQRG